MSVANSGSNVLVNNAGITLAGFTNAAASNIKTVDNLYNISSNAAGGSANGTILLQKASGAVANLQTTKLFQTQAYPQIDAGSSSDSPVSNMYIDFSDATLTCTGSPIVSEIVAPMKLNERSKIIWSGGSWNSIHPGVQIDGATIIFTGATDCHLGYNPAGYVRNPKLVNVGTSDADVVMALQPIWSGNTSNDKPVPLDGLVLTSILGNTRIMPFSWSGGTVPWGQPNNAFMLYRDFGYNVGSGSAPNSIKRSYRRSAYTGTASCVYGAVSLNLVYFWVDAYTNLNASGVVTSNKTYLKQANYNVSGTGASDTNVDIFAFRFSPKFVNASEALQSSVAIAVINSNANATSTVIGNFRCKIAASGTTGADGKFVITEPTTKDYNSSTSNRTDSICVNNRATTTKFHKFWEAATKYIVVGDSRGSTGTTFGDVYADSEFTAYYRKAGYLFAIDPLNLTGPVTKTVTLSSDKNYNAAASTSNTTITYSSGVTTVTLGAFTYDLDGIYKAIIDYHSTIDNTELVTTIPVDQNTQTLKYTNKLVITSVAGTTVNSGTSVTSIETTASFTSLGTWNTFITDANGGTKKYSDIADTYIKLTDNLGNVTVAYAQKSSDIYVRTVTGRTYTLVARRIGYSSFTDSTITAATGTYTLAMTRDKILWPLDSTKTVADLRTDADALTVYDLATNGNVTFKDAGTFYNSYLKFSRLAELDSAKTVPTYDGTTLSIAGNASMESGATVGLNDVDKNLVCTGTFSGAMGNVFITDSAGTTKKISGVNECYLSIVDNTSASVVAYAKRTTDTLYIKTTTGKTYSYKVRQIGSSPFAGTFDASKGTVTPSLQRDKVLWPLDSTKTIADLRTDADALTGYTLATNGNIVLKANGNLSDAYLSYSRQVETDSSKTLPTYIGTVMTGVGTGSTPSGSLTGTGTLSLTGAWSGNQGTVLIIDSAGKSSKLKIQGINDSSIGILDDTGTLVHFEAITGTNQNFDFNTDSGDTGTWTYIVTSYGNKIIKGAFTPASGQVFSVNVSYIPDTGVVGTKAVTAALTNLSTDQKIYDYLSYWHTTQSGIIVEPFITISPAGIDVGSYNVTQNETATSNISVSGSNLTIKASNMSGTALYSTGNFTSNSGTIDNSYKIRCANQDSELVLTNISRLRVYPTSDDRDTGQNLAINITSPVYRFKYGSTVNGVNLANTLITKVTSGSTIDNDQSIKKGENIFSLDNTALLILIKSTTDKLQITNGRVEATINTVPTQDETFIIESPSTIASIAALDKPEWYFYARDSSGQFFNPGSQSFIANMYRGNSVIQLELNVDYDTSEKYSKITLNTTNNITEYKIGDTVKLYCSVLINGVTKQSPITQSTVVAGNVQEVLTLSQIENSTKLAMKAHLEVVNTGIKNASLLIPHTGDL